MSDFSSLDFCTLCNGYDTIQTYIPCYPSEDNIPRFFHVCEKCLAKYTVEEMQIQMVEKFYGKTVANQLRKSNKKPVG
ncbi:MAG: hypothetical protein J6S85_09310 [Methanobrevibacter sp.]|nr:hypothetical protein [Methanobrevibacter sp.]